MTPLMKQKGESTKRPNLVFIFPDQLSFRAMSVYGNDVIRTPSMQRLADEGVVFENCYCNAPLCGPARFATYTGLMPFAQANWANPNCAVFPFLDYMGDYFHAIGYRTGSIGKLHGAPEDADFGFEYCRICEGFGGNPWNDYGRWLRERLDSRSDAAALREKIDAGPIREPFLPRELSEETWIVERVHDFLAGDDGARPFLLNLGFQHPHPAWETLPNENEIYARDAVPLPPNLESRTPIIEACRAAGSYLDGGTLDQADRTPAAWRDLAAQYYAVVTQVDTAIGQVMDLLQRHGHGNDTIIMLCSDHGELMGSYGLVQKGYFYEDAAHLPLIVRGPGVPAGERRAQLCDQTDLLPTLLDLAGAAVPPVLEGTSLAPAIRNADAPSKPFVHGWLELCGRLHQMTRGRRYKLMHFGGLPQSLPEDLPERFECYDLEADPFEMHDLGPDAGADELDELKQAYCDYFLSRAGKRGCWSRARTRLLGAGRD